MITHKGFFYLLFLFIKFIVPSKRSYIMDFEEIKRSALPLPL